MHPDRLKEQFASKTEPATEAQTENEQTLGVSRRDFIRGGVLAGGDRQPRSQHARRPP